MLYEKAIEHEDKYVASAKDGQRVIHRGELSATYAAHVLRELAHEAETLWTDRNTVGTKAAVMLRAEAERLERGE